jgi:hypothetical protein
MVRSAFYGFSQKALLTYRVVDIENVHLPPEELKEPPKKPIDALWGNYNVFSRFFFQG